MSDQVEKTAETDVAAEGSKAADTPNRKSFQCISPKSDWHILGIAFFTSIITVIIYHFVIMAVNEYCHADEDPVVSCYCHRNNSEEDGEAEAKKERRKAFLSKLTPEQREHLKSLKTKEERREYIRSIFKDKAPKGKRGKGPRPPKAKAPAEK
ncbi:MAG: hypothetical protein IKC89_02125 [Lentisphaeria bacterium]|nr:hypothetical protein [Lentisphaeria bacterium]